MARLASAVKNIAWNQDSPARCSSAMIAPVSSSQAEAPNTTAMPAQARPRPNALRARARSAEISRRNARLVSLADPSVALPASLTARKLSSRPGASGRGVSLPGTSSGPGADDT